MALTDTKIRNLKPTGKRFELPDRDGLVLRVSASGVMSWSVTYRVRAAGAVVGSRGSTLAGAKRRATLGEYPTMSLAEARAKAGEIKRTARQGIEPVTKAPESPCDTSVAALVGRYVQSHLKRNLKSGANIEKLLRLHIVPVWGHREVASLQRGDLVALLEVVRVPRFATKLTSAGNKQRVVRGGPGAAAEVRKWARALFQYALDIAFIDRNPFDGVRNPDRQRSRSRVLTMSEARAVWSAAGAIPYPFGAYFQLLMLTGARRNEWAAAQRGWLDTVNGRLEIPAEAYKSDRPHVIPLCDHARRIVEALPDQASGPYVLSTTDGERPISGFSKAKAELDAALAISGVMVKPWVVHDLRRTMATNMERIGIAPHIIELCLGHSLKGVAAVYRQYQYLPEKLAALEAWSRELTAPAQVSELRTDAAKTRQFQPAE